MKLTKRGLEKLILEELTGDDNESQDPVQQYIDYIVMIQEAARESLEAIENGEEPYKAALASQFNAYVTGFTDQEFYHHFFG